MFKKIKLTLLFSLVIGSVHGQQVDTFLQFVHANEELFWEIVSKNYPFSENEIDQYLGDIDFYDLSANEHIEWTAELIKKYESRLFKESTFPRNKGVRWDEPLIREFLDRDWFNWSELYFNRELTISKKLFEENKHNFVNLNFLIRETTDSVTFYYKHPYLQEEMDVESFLTKYNHTQDSTWSSNSKEVKKYFGQDINTIPLDTLSKYKNVFNWYTMTRCYEINWTWNMFIRHFHDLEKRIIPDNNSIYQSLFEPRLDSISLSRLAREFDQKVRYFKLEDGDDQFGMTPDIDLVAPIRKYHVREVFNFGDTLPTSLPNYKYKIGVSPIGPKRFLDILFFEHGYRFPGFICSEKVKSILEAHAISQHAFYPITVTLESQWYGTDTCSYFLFVTNNASLLSELKPESIQFRISRNRYALDGIDSTLVDSLKIKSLHDFQRYIGRWHRFGEYRYREIAQIALQNQLDLLTIRGDDIFISERLMYALKDANITGIRFKKDYSKEWFFDHPTPEKIEGLNPERYFNPKISDLQKTVEQYKLAKERQVQLASNHNFVSDYYKDLDRSKLDSTELKIIDLEIEWNVVLPDVYRNYLRKNTFPKFGREFREWGFEFVPIDRLEQVHKEWYRYVPQTFRGVLFAENGMGDYLGLLLDPDSDFKLSDTIYMFDHEYAGVVRSVQMK
ncbi:MAG: SMI1/KNR4 family protein [Saprospiraceae bacterium]